MMITKQIKQNYYQNIVRQQIYNMTTTAQEFQLLKQHMRRQQARKSQNHKFRTINTIKWKQLILSSFQKLKSHPEYDQSLIADLKTLVSKIPEESFIEAIINMQPLKPNFTASTYSRKSQAMPKKPLLYRKFQLSPAKDSQQESTNASSMVRQSYFEQKSAAKKMKETYEHFTTMIEQETLRKQLSNLHHPFSKIIDGLTFLLQNKYKFVIQKMEKEQGNVIMEMLLKKIQIDVKMLDNLFKMASKPIVEMFCNEGNSGISRFQSDFDNFIVNFLRNHEKYCSSLKKIIKYASKKSIQVAQFQHFSLDLAEIDKFDIPEEFKIQGHYAYTTNSIIQFTEAVKGKKSLEALSSIRNHFYKDINEYQQVKEGQRHEVNSEIQLQIFKFMLTKLKIFSTQIFAQLKYLEILYGEEQIGFQYDEASYMHSQLLIGFQAIRLKL